MLENFNSSTELKFKELSPEEKEQRGILGRLYGPIASIVKATRNGRRYTESLWEKVFKNPITQEMFQNGGIPGELDHPIDREETDSSRIAITSGLCKSNNQYLKESIDSKYLNLSTS